MAKKALKVLSDKEIAKKYNRSGIASDIIVNNDKSLRLPFLSLWLNYQTGGGLPYGRVIEIFGYESTGKTLLAKQICTVAQSLGGVALWGDIEQAFDYYWAEQNGMDLDRTYMYEANDIEGWSDWARDMIIQQRSLLTKNEPIVLVADSIAAFECFDNIGSDSTNQKAQMGNRAKAIYRMYRERNDFFSQYGVILIMINQVRDKVGASMFESSITTPGGGATKFYASIRIAIVRSTQIKGRVVKGKFKEDKTKGIKVGQNVIVKIEKNKTAPPRPNVKTQVYFLDDVTGYVGYSKYEGLLDILLELKVIKKKGTRYYYKETMVCNGAANFARALEENEEIRKKIIKKSGIPTVSSFRAKLNSLTKNYYPIVTKGTQSEEEDEDE